MAVTKSIQSLGLVVLLASMPGCSPNLDCSAPNAVSVGDSSSVDAVYEAGGVVEFDLTLPEKGAERSRCSFFLKSIDGQTVTILTARHCLKPLETTGARLFVAAPQGGYLQVPFIPDAVSDAAEAKAMLAASGVSPANIENAMKAFDNTMAFSVAKKFLLETKSHGSAIECKSDIKRDGDSRLCFLYMDLIEIKGQVSISALSSDDAALFADITSRVSYRTTGPASLEVINLDSARTILKRLSSADVIDEIVGCERGGQSGMCPEYTGIFRVLVQYFSDDVTTSRTLSGNLVDFLIPEYGRVVGSASLTNRRLPMRLSGNIASGNGLGYFSYELAAAEPEFRAGSVFFTVPQTSKQLDFIAGDSGTVLFVNGIPMAALTRANEDRTSDGFAINDLPPPQSRRRTGDGSASSQTTSNATSEATRRASRGCR